MTNTDVENMKNMIDELEEMVKIKSDENELLNEKNKALRQKNECLESILESIRRTEHPEDSEKTICENETDRDALIADLQDQHQQDCIRINDLTTTVHVLAGLYSESRKNTGWNDGK